MGWVPFGPRDDGSGDTCQFPSPHNVPGVLGFMTFTGPFDGWYAG